MDLTSEFLKEEILKMASVTENIINISTDSTIDIAQVFELENQINAYHKQMDDNVFKYIALKRPAAGDLRMALSIMKINSELERMGDQSVNTRRYREYVGELSPLVKSIVSEVKMMVKDVMECFINQNTRLATDVIQHDSIVNDLNKQIIKSHLEQMKNSTLNFDEGFNLIKIAKSFERLGDHATNIAEDVIFLKEGHDIRHDPTIKYGRRKDDFVEDKDTENVNYGRRKDDN